MNSCAYVILNLKNNKRYYGSTDDFYDRKSAHLCYLRKKKHTNKNLQKDFNIYGEDSFNFKIIISHGDREYLYQKEQSLIDKYINSGLLYNMGNNAKARKGIPCPEKIKEKLSRERTGKNWVWFGKKHSDETKEKIRKANTGTVFTEERKRKIGLKSKGRIPNNLTRIKMSISHKKFWKNRQAT
jgi:group I intron endonuclease